MQTNPGLNHQARAYFLQQGQSIEKLQDILDSNVFMHHARKWMSLFLELMLYIFFICALILIMAFPIFLEIQLLSNPTVTIEMRIEELSFFILLMRVILVLLTLPILFFALLLRRNRKKNTLIHEAFAEVKKMKEGFDGAVRTLGL